MKSIIRSFSVEEMSKTFCAAEPFPSMVLDNFLESDFAQAVTSAYPSYSEARSLGREFVAVNEKRKIQITDTRNFPGPVKRLAEEISSPSFLRRLETITGIHRLEPDPRFLGGGMHLTGPGGRLDVHVDFNIDRELGLHRRLNILIYLNEVWKDEWGGELELWDPDVKACRHSIRPIFNRCVVFATSEISFHGVQPVRCPDGATRNSFAAYYYTREAPAEWDGSFHSTKFRARPFERVRKYVLMPSEHVLRWLSRLSRRIKSALRKLAR